MCWGVGGWNQDRERENFWKIIKRVATFYRNQRVCYCPAKTGNYQNLCFIHFRLDFAIHQYISLSWYILLKSCSRQDISIFEHVMNRVGNRKSSLSSFYQIRKNVFFFSFLTSFYISKPNIVLSFLLSFTSVSSNKPA